MIKHATASTFVYDRPTSDAQERCILLLWHRKFSRWMIPGGHVESQETCDDAATREVQEETGLNVALLRPPQAERGRLAWAIVEQRIEARPGEPEHVHIDHLYVARRIDEDAAPQGAEWVALRDLDSREMFEGTRELALAFARDLVTGAR